MPTWLSTAIASGPSASPEPAAHARCMRSARSYSASDSSTFPAAPVSACWRAMSACLDTRRATSTWFSPSTWALTVAARSNVAIAASNRPAARWSSATLEVAGEGGGATPVGGGRRDAGVDGTAASVEATAPISGAASARNAGLVCRTMMVLFGREPGGEAHGGGSAMGSMQLAAIGFRMQWRNSREKSWKKIPYLVPLSFVVGSPSPAGVAGPPAPLADVRGARRGRQGLLQEVLVGSLPLQAPQVL